MLENVPKCINQQFHFANLTQKAVQRWISFKPKPTSQRGITSLVPFLNAQEIIPLQETFKAVSPCPWGQCQQVTHSCQGPGHSKTLATYFVLTFCEVSLGHQALFTGFQPKVFNNRKQKGGVRFPVRLLTRSFWPSIVKYQQEGICITINTLDIITRQFSLKGEF